MNEEEGQCPRNKVCEGCVDNRLSARLKRVANMISRGKSPEVYAGQLGTENRLTYCKQLMRARPLSLDVRQYK